MRDPYKDMADMAMFTVGILIMGAAIVTTLWWVIQ